MCIRDRRIQSASEKEVGFNLDLPSEQIGGTGPSLAQALIENETDLEASREIGFDHVENQFEKLLKEGVEGVHLYALNRMSTVERLGPILKNASGTNSTPHL